MSNQQPLQLKSKIGKKSNDSLGGSKPLPPLKLKSGWGALRDNKTKLGEAGGANEEKQTERGTEVKGMGSAHGSLFPPIMTTAANKLSFDNLHTQEQVDTNQDLVTDRNTKTDRNMLTGRGSCKVLDEKFAVNAYSL